MAKPLYKNLTVQVLTAIFIGAVIGKIRPDWGDNFKLLGDAFISLVKMVIGPIIFLTIVVGIAHMGDLKKVGRVGWKALLYFEIVTTVALAIGLLVANIIQPGANVAAVATAVKPAASQPAQTMSQFLLNIIPDNVVNAFAKGDLLQILFFAVIFGIAVAGIGQRGEPIVRGFEYLTEAMFRVVALIMKFAPLGAMGAMCYTVSRFGAAAFAPLVKVMACVYLTMALFIFVVLGSLCRYFGFSLIQFLRYIRQELLLALGTSSSESVLPRMIEKMEMVGCSRGIVGLVIPAGYSFNLDGTSIYLSVGALFVAQAANIHLSLKEQLTILGILMLTSKGAAGVTGSGYITLQATLQATKTLPLDGMPMLLGVDRFMSEARTITNLIGNGVATLIISKMEGEFDQEKFDAAMAGLPVPGPAPVEAKADLLSVG